MRIELFGIARARAGCEWVDLEAATLEEAVALLVARCPGLEPEVVAGGRLTGAYLASLDGERFVSDPATPLAGAARLLILGAQVGG